MKKILHILLCSVLLFSCSKTNNVDPIISDNIVKVNLNIEGSEVSTYSEPGFDHENMIKEVTLYLYNAAGVVLTSKSFTLTTISKTYQLSFDYPNMSDVTKIVAYVKGNTEKTASETRESPSFPYNSFSMVGYTTAISYKMSIDMVRMHAKVRTIVRKAANAIGNFTIDYENIEIQVPVTRYPETDQTYLEDNYFFDVAPDTRSFSAITDVYPTDATLVYGHGYHKRTGFYTGGAESMGFSYLDPTSTSYTNTTDPQLTSTSDCRQNLRPSPWKFNTTNGGQVDSLYIREDMNGTMSSDIEPRLIIRIPTISNGVKNYFETTVSLHDADGTKCVRRNHIYDVVVELTSPAAADNIYCNEMEWKDVYIPAKIEGTYLDISSEVCLWDGIRTYQQIYYGTDADTVFCRIEGEGTHGEGYNVQMNPPGMFEITTDYNNNVEEYLRNYYIDNLGTKTTIDGVTWYYTTTKDSLNIYSEDTWINSPLSLSLVFKVGNITKKTCVFAYGDAHSWKVNNKRKVAITSIDVPTDATWLHTAIVANGFTVEADENVTPINNADVLLHDTVEPIFKDRRTTITINYSDGNVENLVYAQKGPIYIGTLGSYDVSAKTYSKRLIAEQIGEQRNMYWYTSNSVTGPSTGVYREDGLENWNFFASTSTPSNFIAAYDCYMRNDLNHDGVVTAAEYASIPNPWYLPAQRQLDGMFVYGLQTNLMGDSSGWLWSSSESSYLTGNEAWLLHFSSNGYGRQEATGKNGNSNGVRCVKNM